MWNEAGEDTGRCNASASQPSDVATIELRLAQDGSIGNYIADRRISCPAWPPGADAQALPGSEPRIEDRAPGHCRGCLCKVIGIAPPPDRLRTRSAPRSLGRRNEYPRKPAWMLHRVGFFNEYPRAPFPPVPGVRKRWTDYLPAGHRLRPWQPPPRPPLATPLG